MINPGKKPAAMARPGKDGQSVSMDALVPFTSEAVVGKRNKVEVAVTVGSCVVAERVEAVWVVWVVWVDEVDEVVVCEVVVDVAFSLRQTFPPWHEKPWGQHKFPHLGRFLSSFVVINGFPGFTSGSCSLTSQVIGWIRPHPPSGQHRADDEPSKLIHVESFGQQKFEGSFGSSQRLKFEPGHEPVSRCSRPTACAVVTAIVSAVADGTVDDNRQTKDNFCNLERLAMLLA